VVLSDDRPGKGAEDLTILTGTHRTVFLACDEVTTAAQLGELVAKATRDGVGAQELSAAVGDLVTEGFVLRDGRRYLSLGLRQASRTPSC